MATKTTKRKRASTNKAKASIAVATAAPVQAAQPAASRTAVEPELPAAAAPAPSAQSTVTSAAPPSVETTISLSSNCTVKDAGHFKDELLRWLDEPQSVAIDAKSVERIDTAIVQLLCAFVRDRAAQNRGVSWVAPPRPLLDAARMLGVSAALALPTETAP